MARTRLDLPTQLPEGVARPIFAGVGVTDRVVEVVRDYVADVSKRALAVQQDVQRTVSGLDYQPQALRDPAGQVGKVLSASVESFNADARSLPTRLQKLVDGRVATAGDTYDELVKRGETLVGRIRRQQSTQRATASANTTVVKAKTTRTQATKTAQSSTASAKKSVKKTARKSSARSSAKATGTAASKTASSATKAATDAAQKVGD
jgi:heparin binding hemagglutinin HbhA